METGGGWASCGKDGGGHKTTTAHAQDPHNEHIVHSLRGTCALGKGTGEM
jgi:hypothetical protein